MRSTLGDDMMRQVDVEGARKQIVRRGIREGTHYHVHQHSRGMEARLVEGRVVTLLDGRELDRLEVEEDADMYVCWWGFDVDAIDEWDRDHGVARVRHLDRMSPSGVRRLLKAQRRN